MSKKHILIGLLCVLCGSYVALGQENFKSTVTIEKDFEGKLMGVQKSELNKSYSDTLTKLNLNFDYSVFDRPYKDLYEFSPVEGVKLQKKGEAQYPVLFLKAALSYPLMPEGDLYIQPRLGRGNSLVIYGNHSSFWGNKDTIVGSPVNRSNTKGGLSYGYNWSKGELRLDGFYKYDYRFFNKNKSYNYGAQNTQMAGGNFMLRSLNPDKNSFYYDVNGGYTFTSCQKSSQEGLIEGDLNLGFKIKGNHRLNIGGKVTHSRYSTVLHNQDKGQGVSFENRGVFEVTPQYILTLPRINIRAGVSVGGDYSQDQSAGTFKIYPQVQFTFEAVRKALWLKVKVDGENRLYSVRDMLNLNPWVDVDEIESCYIPLRGVVGLSGVVGDVFGYNVEGGYVRHDQFLSFYGVNDLQRSYVSEDVNEWNASAGIMVKTQSLDVNVKGQYRSFGDAIVYMVPSLFVDGNIKYNYMGRIFAEVGGKYYSPVEGKGVSYNGFVDLSAKFTYAANSKVSIFAQGKNLLNNKIFLVQDYVEPGLNFGLGLFIKL